MCCDVLLTDTEFILLVGKETETLLLGGFGSRWRWDSPGFGTWESRSRAQGRAGMQSCEQTCPPQMTINYCPFNEGMGLWASPKPFIAQTGISLKALRFQNSAIAQKQSRAASFQGNTEHSNPMEWINIIIINKQRLICFSNLSAATCTYPVTQWIIITGTHLHFCYSISTLAYPIQWHHCTTKPFTILPNPVPYLLKHFLTYNCGNTLLSFSCSMSVCFYFYINPRLQTKPFSTCASFHLCVPSSTGSGSGQAEPFQPPLCGPVPPDTLPQAICRPWSTSTRAVIGIILYPVSAGAVKQRGSAEGPWERNKWV